MHRFFGKNNILVRRIVLFGLFFSSGIFLLLSLFKPIIQDEGVFLTIGRYLTDGYLPYRDFFDHKNGGIYMLGFLISVFSKNALFIRFVMLSMNFLIATLIYYYCKQSGQKNSYWAAGAFLFSTVFYQGNFFLTELPTVVFLLLSLLFTQKKYYFLGGAMMAISFLFKQTAIINAVVLFSYLLYWNRPAILKFLIGFFVPILSYCTLLFLFGIQKEAFSQTVIYNLISYPHEPFSKVLFYFWGGLKRTFWVWLALPWAISQKKYRFEIVTFFVIIPLFFLLNRSYLHYWLQILPFVCILFGALIDNIEANNKYLFIIFSTIIFSLIVNLRFSYYIFRNDDYPQYIEQKEAIQAINKRPEKFLLAENKHAGFYFLCNKNPISKYLFTTEINDKTENAESKIIESLRMNDSVVILWTTGKEPAYAKQLEKVVQSKNEVARYNNLDLIVFKN